ncbi:5-formyltetrahydrofolate cyclo-ligase [Bacillus cereus group sp. BC251]|uniref:5-formyltetrahydrofolate cyclo-ligase n=1 Tax=Bacillus thuringiensis serovar mexicanensis TaxID=180868 RepID=A0A242W7W7_BACTU|nr:MULTISPECIES: 5-formyltetrahydrofolate cyclo-ligase [Bacillus]COE13014.1 5-formyltetrahydrofolate cyclo-ligase [Streptococcus pneumoniae]AJH80364.1 5-formyltetrahydrofolate cyclo-ligase [Bacillus thuringiensis]AUD22439.1 5-formyltetrahydrofolate cyclo-ligase [Bacillus sp. HBCD-sjtu]EEM58004.1 5-formyltetrahydrofolate cyclo-ligase [Bacillus thuringiensis serovar monterrey BGSC 4AJ1]EEM69940.1 5-formyltetrahydrofolate cyclo-ligase [Bacillus thuringiensis serovar andalousiensis BGSC 4AW1]
MREEKLRLRKQIIEHMNSLSKERYTTLSEQIAFSLYEQKEWAETKTIGITLSMENEVNTYPIIEKAWEEGKRVVVPKCNKETRTMSFRQISNFDQLETVYMNLREPIPALTEEVNADEIDLQIVPGVAYTERGERIGYGGGYYDRYLVHYKGKTLSLAYSFQMVEHIPVEPFDKNVEKIITEKGTMVKNGLV